MKLYGLRSRGHVPQKQEPDWESAIDPDGIRSIDLDPAELDEPKLQQLFDHWSSARQGRPWLMRADFRPEECATVLPHLALIERLAETIPFLKIRLTGDRIANPGFGFVKGGFVEELTPDWYRDHLMTSYMSAFVAGAPLYQLARVVFRCQVILYRRLILPVTRSGDAVDMLLVASVRTRRLADFITFGREDV